MKCPRVAWLVLSWHRDWCDVLIFFSCVLSGLWSAGVQDAGVNEQCGDILTSKRFMLDMLYAHNRKPADDEEKGEARLRDRAGAEAVASLARWISTLQASSLAQDESVKRVDGCLDNRGSVKALRRNSTRGPRRGPSPTRSPMTRSQRRHQLSPRRNPTTSGTSSWPIPGSSESRTWISLTWVRRMHIDVLDVDLGHPRPQGHLPAPTHLSGNLPPHPLHPLLDSVPPPPVPGNLLAPPPVFNAPQGLGWPQVPRGQPAFTKKRRPSVCSGTKSAF